MKDFTQITYQFQESMTTKEFGSIQQDIEKCGGSVMYRALRAEDAFYVVKVAGSAAASFIEEFKKTESYKRTEEYKAEQKELFFIRVVNEGYMHWTEERLQHILQSAVMAKEGGADDAASLLAILLNEGLLRIRAEEYAVVPEPSDHTRERQAYYDCFNQPGNTTIGRLRWYAWNWLKKKEGDIPFFNSSLGTLYAPTRKVHLKVGEGNPFQIMYHILGDDGSTYVHVPDYSVCYLYIFEATELFHPWLENHRYGSHFQNPTELQKLLASYVHHVRGSEALRKQLQVYLEENGADRETQPEELLLSSYEDGTLFDVADAASIIQHGRGEEMTEDLLEILITQGEIRAQRLKDMWVISKESLVQYLEPFLKQSSETNKLEEAPKEEKAEATIQAVEEDLAPRYQLRLYHHTTEFTLKEVAQFMRYDEQYGDGLSRTVRAIERLIELGELPAEKTRRSWHVRKRDLEAYLEKKQNGNFDTKPTEKPKTKEATKAKRTSASVSRKSSVNSITTELWDTKKDEVLIKHVLNGLKAGKTFEEIFSKGIWKINMTGQQCKNRWYNKWSHVFKDEVTQMRRELLEQAMHMEQTAKDAPHTTNDRARVYPAGWTSYKEDILIKAILEGAREGRTLKDITQEVGENLGISPAVCQSYWYNHVPAHFRETFKQIKLDQETNWSEEDIKLFEHIVYVEHANMPPYQVLPIVGQRLKRHIDAVRKKWYELQRERQVRR